MKTILVIFICGFCVFAQVLEKKILIGEFEVIVNEQGLKVNGNNLQPNQWTAATIIQPNNSFSGTGTLTIENKSVQVAINNIKLKIETRETRDRVLH